MELHNFKNFKNSLNETKLLSLDELKSKMPYNAEFFKDIIKDVCEKYNRDYKILYSDEKPSIYDTFAYYSLNVDLNLNDAGQTDTLPDGTLYSKKGVRIQFYLNKYINDKGDDIFEIGASKNTPGGMKMYNKKRITNVSKEAIEYVKSIIHNNKPNDTEDFVY